MTTDKTRAELEHEVNQDTETVWFAHCVIEDEAPDTKRGWKRCSYRTRVTAATHRLLPQAVDRDGKVIVVLARANDGKLPVRCPNHPEEWLRFGGVKGKLDPTKTCDSACALAVSEKCTCSCGGNGHGRGPLPASQRPPL